MVVVALMENMSDYILTIAIPAYNREPFIRRLLNKIITESNNEVEIIISDNASTDNTETMMQTEFSEITYYRNEENLGADGNFLECYRKAKGEYIWLVGSDDIIVEGSIKRVLQFIKDHSDEDMPLIFLNHNSFEGEYRGKEYCKEAYLNENKEDKIARSKHELIEFSGRQLTFMSAFLLKKEYVNRITNPERYLQTNFIQTYFALNVIKEANCFGIIFYPCVSQDLTPGNSLFHKNYSKLFHVFGTCMYESFVRYSVSIGFDKRQMKKKYIDGLLKKFISWILRAKAIEDKGGIEVFWKEVYPILKTYPIAWVTIIPIAVSPSLLAKLYYRLKSRGKHLE